MSGYRTRQDGSYQPPVVGRETQIGYAPPQPGQVSRPSKSYDYNRGLPEIEGEKIGQGLSKDIKRGAASAARLGLQAELFQWGVTGTKHWGPGNGRQEGGGFPDGGKTIPSGDMGDGFGGLPGSPGVDKGDGFGGVPKRRYSAAQPRSADSGTPGTEKAHHRIEPRQLMAGPRVHSVGSQKELPPAGNPLNARTTRALGPGPAPQFSHELSSEIGQGVHDLGGKRVGPGRPTPTDFKGERVSQPRSQRRAGGNINGIPDYSGEGSSELFGGGKPMPPDK